MEVLVNAAASADGKLDTRARGGFAISDDADFDRVERLRAEVDAVVVGVGTVLADDPHLVRHDTTHRTATYGPDASPPGRVVVDSRCRTPPDARILTDGPATTILASDAADGDRVETLEARGATVLRAGTDRVDLTAGFDALEQRGHDRVLVEGGGELIFSLFAGDLVDELTLYVGPLVIGGRDAPTLADGEGFTENFPALELEDAERVGEGVLLRWTVR